MLPHHANLSVSRVCLISTVVLIVSGSLPHGAIAAAHAPFPCPGYLEPRVEFWVGVFSRYSSRDFIVHDRDQVWKTYEVMHLPGTGYPSAGEIARVDNYLKDKYQRILLWLAAGKEPAGATARKVAALFQDATSAELRAAAANLRIQQGLSDQFARGLVRSSHYRRMMRRIFSAHGLPDGLIYLAAVESEFNPRARSQASAVGIWQFIAPTGRQYLHISRHRDERLDPMRATVAAAKLLRSNYETLGSWPLAITAYNYGAHGMARAAREYDGDYRQILEHWNAPAFGFAVKNYYSEFLAASRIYENQERYFPELPAPREAPLMTAERADTHAHAAGHRATAERHRVRHGETLYAIARHHGVSLASLMRVNRIGNARRLKAGQLLLIPSTGASVSYARARRKRYRVRRGDTLYAIAQRAGVDASRLREVNQIDDPHSLDVGTVLLIPTT
ncbi:MAG TPA: LysM peptidoglycan-binding domain-containing protein [Candidatus Binataceae bacterium]|nr:LysM peptidoglycan-binding domain-containing protein [Candidatus Binataceae bacterium]